jgi:hypothetical protein
VAQPAGHARQRFTFPGEDTVNVRVFEADARRLEATRRVRRESVGESRIPPEPRQIDRHSTMLGAM